MPTIKDYLQKPNPVLRIQASTTHSTDSPQWEPIEGFGEFKEFTYETCKGLYGDLLKYDFDAKELPTPNRLLPVETEIFSERELEQDPLKRHIIAKVNYALRAAYKYLKGKDRSGSAEFEDTPTIVCGTKEPSGGPVPDWIGNQKGIKAFLCGETKLSTVFSMEDTINSPDRRLDTPVEQCLYYCIKKDTRYGFMITDEELVILCIRQEAMKDGIASERPRRAIPPARYSFGSSLVSSTEAMSLYSNSKQPQGSPKYIAYRVVDWSATNGLTVCLALFLITLMAAAPTIDIDIGDQYEPLNRWKWEADIGRYRNNTSGRVQKRLDQGHLELVTWTEHMDSDQHKFFNSYKGATYLQEFWDDENRVFYIYNHHSGTRLPEKPQGSFPRSSCHV
jgi:hypothetical protein